MCHLKAVRIEKGTGTDSFFCLQEDSNSPLSWTQSKVFFTPLLKTLVLSMPGPYVRGGERKDSPAGAPPVAFKGQRQIDIPPSTYSRSVTYAVPCATFGSYPYRGYENLIKQSFTII